MLSVVQHVRTLIISSSIAFVLTEFGQSRVTNEISPTVAVKKNKVHWLVQTQEGKALPKS
jgi:hypothetical protein